LSRKLYNFILKNRRGLPLDKAARGCYDFTNRRKCDEKEASSKQNPHTREWPPPAESGLEEREGVTTFEQLPERGTGRSRRTAQGGTAGTVIGRKRGSATAL
jgi:hypothetical protein